MPHLAVVPRQNVTIPDPNEIAVAVVIAEIVHELKRAAVKPIAHVFYGPVGASHDRGIAFGWLARAGTGAFRNSLVLTDSGRRALIAAQQGGTR